MVLTRQAPAKLNFGLHVLRRRPDGFHDLETVFYPIEWADTVSARRAEDLTLTSSDASLDTGESNLVMKAARALSSAFGVDCGAELRLTKRLPLGSGLGGGSSDAASALRILGDLWGLSVPAPALEKMALSLGSDVPFFLETLPAYATGRGEVLARLHGYRLPYTLVVVVAPVHVSTAWAFGRIRPRETGRPDLREVVASNDLGRWRGDLRNDFEGPVFEAYPELRRAKDVLLQAGAGYAALTGTGAAVFGAFDDENAARAAARAARQEGCKVWKA